MRLLANENIPLASVRHLRSLGYDVAYIGDGNAGVHDEDVMALAQAEDRIIITMDRDYGELIFKKGLINPAGVIYLRLDLFDVNEPAELTHQLLNSPDITMHRNFTVVTRENIRQRKF